MSSSFWQTRRFKESEGRTLPNPDLKHSNALSCKELWIKTLCLKGIHFYSTELKVVLQPFLLSHHMFKLLQTLTILENKL